VHAACGSSALTPGDEINCGVCRSACSPFECTLLAPRGRDRQLVESAIAGGPAQRVVAAFSKEAAAFAVRAHPPDEPGAHVLVTTHFVDADGELQGSFSGVLSRGRGNRRLLMRLGALAHHFTLLSDAAAAEAASPPAHSVAELRAFALLEQRGTWRFLYALASGSAEWRPADGIVVNSTQWTSLAPAYVA
jgi:hypothetical protein